MKGTRIAALIGIAVVALASACEMKRPAKRDFQVPSRAEGESCTATYECAYPYACMDGKCALPPAGNTGSTVPSAQDVWPDSWDACCDPSDPCNWGNDGVCDCGGQFEWDWNDCYGYQDVVYPPGDVSGDCCSWNDPCGWAGDGECDCGGEFEWDHADCSGNGEAWYVDYGSIEDAYDYGFYDLPSECCEPWDACGWADDGVCDCDGEFEWDWNDCYGYNDAYPSPDVYTGEIGWAEIGSCCESWDPCDWANDGACDCDGEFEWDWNDCYGSEEDAYASGDASYADVIYWTDVYGEGSSCCTATDPCGWANDGMCDCDGKFKWDSNDCK